ncbi:MAG TPA: hypothetical protein VHO90_20685 [Bacteroidales bacterium]|nr:hypothetical protein [Bacteroidales bacterium]
MNFIAGCFKDLIGVTFDFFLWNVSIDYKTWFIYRCIVDVEGLTFIVEGFIVKIDDLIVDVDDIFLKIVGSTISKEA